MIQAPPGYLAVVAAALFGPDRRLLLSRRHVHAHQGGLWEFPGGKYEPGEQPRKALARELDEELGIEPIECRRLIQIPFEYPELRVWLDVWRVDRFRGEPSGREAQTIGWFELSQLTELAMPPANRPIVDALRLPDTIAITPNPLPKRDQLLRRAERLLDAGVGAIQLRAPALSGVQLVPVARDLAAVCASRGAICFVNIEPRYFAASGAQALHLPAHRLMALTRRPLAASSIVSAACHDEAQLRKAEQLGVSCVLVSPLRLTSTHPERAALGWPRFAELCRASRLPVFALGGMRVSDLQQVRAAGGQGVAAISEFW